MRIALPPLIDCAAVQCDAGAAVVALGGETMGTVWRVKLATPSGFNAAAAQRAIVARLATIVAQMSQWEPNSLLSRFNRAAAGTWTLVPPDFAAVIDAGLVTARASDGAFDPTLGRLVDLWGFGATAMAAPPDDVAVEAAREAAGWRRLAWHAASRSLRQPGGLALDLAGIAKGYAVDVVADLLSGLGVPHCLVEIGGEFVGRGVRPDGEPWWVELEDPPGMPLPALRIALHGLAVATSGDYRRGGHTLDPRTGRATTNGVMSVSVIHETALAADAWATALTVLGPEDGMAVAGRAGIAARWVVASDDDVRELVSPALSAMLDD